MQTNETQTAVSVAAQPVPAIETVRAVTDQAASDRSALAAKLAEARAQNVANGKPANAPLSEPKPVKRRAKRAAKQSANKPVNAAPKPAKPTQAERDAQREASASQRSAERAAAAKAVADYIGASKPFKSASDTFAPINHHNAKPGPSGYGTVRQAVLLLAMLRYSAGNIDASGRFVRGGFRIPARLLNPQAPRDAMLAAQPESGALGNCIGQTVAYVSGPQSGIGQRDAIYRIDFAAMRKLIQATLGDKAVKAANVLIAGFTVASEAAKRQAA
jgi:hypothetical protein